MKVTKKMMMEEEESSDEEAEETMEAKAEASAKANMAAAAKEAEGKKKKKKKETDESAAHLKSAVSLSDKRVVSKASAMMEKAAALPAGSPQQMAAMQEVHSMMAQSASVSSRAAVMMQEAGELPAGSPQQMVAMKEVQVMMAQSASVPSKAAAMMQEAAELPAGSPQREQQQMLAMEQMNAEVAQTTSAPSKAAVMMAKAAALPAGAEREEHQQLAMKQLEAEVANAQSASLDPMAVYSARAENKWDQMESDSVLGSGGGYLESDDEVSALAEWVWSSFRPEQSIKYRGKQLEEETKKLREQCGKGEDDGRVNKEEFLKYYDKTAASMVKLHNDHKKKHEEARKKAAAPRVPDTPRTGAARAMLAATLLPAKDPPPPPLRLSAAKSDGGRTLSASESEREADDFVSREKMMQLLETLNGMKEEKKQRSTALSPYASPRITSNAPLEKDMNHQQQQRRFSPPQNASPRGRLEPYWDGQDRNGTPPMPPVRRALTQFDSCEFDGRWTFVWRSIPGAPDAINVTVRDGSWTLRGQRYQLEYGDYPQIGSPPSGTRSRPRFRCNDGSIQTLIGTSKSGALQWNSTSLDPLFCIAEWRRRVTIPNARVPPGLTPGVVSAYARNSPAAVAATKKMGSGRSMDCSLTASSQRSPSPARPPRRVQPIPSPQARGSTPERPRLALRNQHSEDRINSFLTAKTGAIQPPSFQMPTTNMVTRMDSRTLLPPPHSAERETRRRFFELEARPTELERIRSTIQRQAHQIMQDSRAKDVALEEKRRVVEHQATMMAAQARQLAAAEARIRSLSPPPHRHNPEQSRGQGGGATRTNRRSTPIHWGILGVWGEQRWSPQAFAIGENGDLYSVHNVSGSTVLQVLAPMAEGIVHLGSDPSTFRIIRSREADAVLETFDFKSSSTVTDRRPWVDVLRQCGWPIVGMR